MTPHLIVIYRWEVVTAAVFLLSIGAALGFGFAKIIK